MQTPENSCRTLNQPALSVVVKMMEAEAVSVIVVVVVPVVEVAVEAGVCVRDHHAPADQADWHSYTDKGVLFLPNIKKIFQRFYFFSWFNDNERLLLFAATDLTGVGGVSLADNSLSLDGCCC
jgi:hypothetical protein